ncbi:HlyD family secretion protein [Oleiagrimonas sp. C23AA]|uniref:efflux RND transporter periplasmic adaptor subunit n=1 Tax=Oleiagrimonas sp. C23AA TaxID=2719047 RepID=UPI0014234F96|nr:HlyD family secretion protein [Oleiagrimonas sp. C23AA]NII10922.1 HlyD family secretion protein [Oleiagrimonas sp. C23AA]
MKIASLTRLVLTLLVLTVAVLALWVLWRHYMYTPWTRDARVQADVVQVAPDVSGLVDRVEVKDNAYVHRGQALWQIDTARFANAVAQAKASLAAAKADAEAAGASRAAAEASAAQARAEFSMRQTQAERRQHMGDVISAEARSDAEATARAARAGLAAASASHRAAGAAQAKALAAVQQAQVTLSLAELNLERSTVHSPVDGYVTHLDVYAGDYATAGTPRMAVIDAHSYRINGYFEEIKMPQVHVGDRARIRLMSGVELHGRVESIAHGMSDRDNTTGSNLLADVSPTFNWVRLAQRVPVRIAIDPDSMPRRQVLVAGMTATVVLDPSTHGAMQVASDTATMVQNSRSSAAHR